MPGNDGLNQHPTDEETPLLRQRDSLEHFCLQLKIDKDTGEPNLPSSLYKKVKMAYYKQNTLYWVITSIALALMLLQIAISVTITALASTRSPDANTTIIILGAINSFMAGSSAIVKSLGQPTRSRQYRDALKRVWDAVERMYGAFKNPEYTGRSFEEATKLEQMYSQAVGDSEANAPDVWVEWNGGPGGGNPPRTQSLGWPV